jgi:hypothetical protein
MNSKNKTLTKYNHFNNAVQQQLPVTVYQDGEILDYGGPIEHHDLHKVTINGMHYVKTACVFVVR